MKKDNTIPVADIVLEKDEQTGTYKYTQTHDISFPKSSSEIACSKKDLKKAKKHLTQIKEEAKKSTSLWVDLCSIIFGISLTLLATLWMSIDPYSCEGFWIHLITLVVFFVSLFFWIWLKQRPSINISEKINIVLDFLPNIEKIEGEEGKEK